jgi:hypothetical protein
MKFFLLFILLSSGQAFADFDLSQMNFGIGMINSSFTETPSGLTPSSSSNAKEEVISSGSVPVIGAFLEYEKYYNSKISIVGKSAFPLMPGATGSYVFLGTGLNYYFKSLSSVGSFVSKDARIFIIPTWRFHAGGGLGGAYMIYNTESAQKSDTLIELYGNVGATYTKNKQWGYRAEFTFARGIGFNSTAMTMKIMMGMVYTFY